MVSREHLIQIARRKSWKEPSRFWIVANDLTQINGEQHKAYLVEKNSFQTATGKQEIADLLLDRILKLNT